MRRRARIASVVGARPQFVKAAIVADALAATGRADHVLIHTGQHYDWPMSAVFFRDLGLGEPDHNLAIGSGPHGQQTGAMLSALESVMSADRFDWVVVYGDTNSTLAAALAAAKLHIPLAHVEAGLRSWNRRMPEEVNRVLTDHASDLLFAPTETAVANLAREGIDPARIELVGDVMFDASVHYARTAIGGAVARLGLQAGNYVLATVHRAENTDDASRLRAIMDGLALAAEQEHCEVVLPLHPRTAEALRLHGITTHGVRLIEPVGYLEMLELEASARLIATDSGGVQKEAFFQRVPCVTLREETEWVELVQAGWNRLAPPTDAEAVAAAVTSALAAARPAEPRTDLYGGGAAGGRIAKRLTTA